jgi:hypothetical protein
VATIEKLSNRSVNMSKHHSAADAAIFAAEEKERKIAEERALAALKLQRKQRLQAMSIKRQRNFAYLKVTKQLIMVTIILSNSIYFRFQKVHQGGCYWLNTVLLSAADVRHLIGHSVSKHRVDSLFTLGVSLSKITVLSAGTGIVRAFSQLMEEWEYVHSGPTMQGVKFMMAKTSPCPYPQMSPIEGFSDLSRPSVYRFNNSVVYEHLQVPHIPFDLDYVEVFLGLCTQLSRLYEKLVHEDCYSNQVVYDAIVRLDTRVKHHVINQVAKEVTEACARKMKNGTRSLRFLAGMSLPSATTGAVSPPMAKAGSSPSLSVSSAVGQPVSDVSVGSPPAKAAGTVVGSKSGIATGPGPTVIAGSDTQSASGSVAGSDSTTATQSAAVSVDNPVVEQKRRQKRSDAHREP